MTLKQLKEKLNKFPEELDDKKVEFYSDYTFSLFNISNVKFHKTYDSIVLSSHSKKIKAKKAKKNAKK